VVARPAFISEENWDVGKLADLDVPSDYEHARLTLL
jgi:hypothetical protein